MAILIWTDARRRPIPSSRPYSRPPPPVVSEPVPDPVVIDKIAALMGHSEWICEKNPSPSLWFRIAGKTGHGLLWTLIQGLPTDRKERRDRGLRWATDDIHVRHLWMEIFPRRVYTRMKQTALLANNPGSVNRSLDSLKMVHEIPPIRFHNPELNEQFVLITVVPTLITMLFTREIEEMLLALNTDAVRISLGYPNLRISLNNEYADIDTIQKLADFGGHLAERYLALTKSAAPSPL
jgi:hypothetical protein